jgi:DNA transposition AAA+ family ATPase
MADHLRIATAQARPRVIGDYQETETAKDIARSLNLIRSQDGPSMTMIAGVPGTGKTMAIKEFCKHIGYHGTYLAIASGEGKASNVATALMDLWRHVANGKSLTRSREMLTVLMGRDALLVIDEAQYLKIEGAEWLRALAESAKCDLVLCGDQNLVPLVTSIPQLDSRMQRKIIIKSVAKEDVQMMAVNAGVRDSEAIHELQLIARKRGGLRNVENVLRMASLFAGNAVPTAAHIKAAIVEMKLAPEGQSR